MSADPIAASVTFAADLLEAIAQRAAEIVLEAMPTVEAATPSYLTVKAAADYLGLSEHAVRHLLDRYPEASACRRRTDPAPPFLDAYLSGERRR
jgi:hypothetical protein